jgi:TPR repeat protein
MLNLGNEMENSFELGRAASDRQDYDQAFAIWLPLAEAGDAASQAELGCLYQVGLGTEYDIAEAERWLLKAAEQGEGSACHNLGTLYIMNDPALSKKWYRKARELGFQVAPDEWYE